MLHLAPQIGKAEVDELDLVVFDFLHYVLRVVCHFTPLCSSLFDAASLGVKRSGVIGCDFAGFAQPVSSSGPGQIASLPVSPVRIRTASSTFDTKILPSPIRPVFAEAMMASIAFSTMPSPSTSSSFTFGRKSTTYSAPR